MSTPHDLTVGTVLANSFKVRNVRQQPVISPRSNPIVDATTIDLEALYQSASFLSFYTFIESPPSSDSWTNLVFTPTPDTRRPRTWRPARIDQECVGIQYKIRTVDGNRVAITQALAAKNKTLVSAKTTWTGFPGFNRYLVGYNPGMKMRTKELLLAGLSLVQ